ncbi:hypothetical protein [uncultured Thiothrix sp.]|uniref:hypothetical protein n=1 Tax=uncultured Thiothrix sp. TaxID=223185 RepID=UPI00262C3807|nr:hypothetical protein [uncultured Thiothrix sp.]HRJ94748.1 hypothetical protein [Candidatus Thiothrix moscowensis]
MLTKKIMVIFTFVLLFAAGCGPEYTYTPPVSAVGQTCVMRCQDTQRECTDEANYRADRKQEKCERDAEHEHYLCLLYAKTDADRAKCQKDGCYEYADTARCDATFRACFQQCGGVIGIVK